jgi:hypothetical protein
MNLSPTFAAAVVAADLPPDVAMALIRRGPQGQTDQAAIDTARTIVDLCNAAGVPTAAAVYVTRCESVDAVRAQLACNPARAAAPGAPTTFVRRAPEEE